ncbi:MAG: D-aminoacylase [Trueperaceae bacterium]|nr:D-aminoacylase [Trueperaceae bacterium]
MPTFDILIRNARIVDGTGNPWFRADVAVKADRIAAVVQPGTIPVENCGEVVDAGGKVLAPGFIDIQSHSIMPLMTDGRCLSKITQGITTEIMGEAWTPAPVGGRFLEPLRNSIVGERVPEEWRQRMLTWSRFGDWLDAYIDQGVSPNVGSFLGGGTTRSYAMDMDMGAPDSDQLETMRRVMAEAMEDGAFGVSYALIYPPDAYTELDELVEVCKVAGKYGGIYITHMRSESHEIFQGLEETFQIAHRANLPAEIYHLKAAHPEAWWRMASVIDRITRARDYGLDVTADMYPYVGSGTGLTAILPTWTAAGGKLYQTLADPEARKRIRAALEGKVVSDGLGLETRGGPQGIMPVGFMKPHNQQYVGKRLSEIAEMRGQDWIEAALDILVDEGQRISTIYFSMDETNLRLQVQQPWIKFSTDAGGVDPAWAKAHGPLHPRAYGTNPRVLAKYVREERLISLEDAVRKMTSSVADRLGMRDRGLVREGMFADLIIFDPDTIQDHATFEDSHQLSTGVSEVWVNGTRVLKGGAHTGATPGRFVKGPGAA